MSNLPDLYHAATVVAQQCLAIRSGETAVVVTDWGRSPRIAEALVAALRAADAEAILVIMPVREGAKEPLPAVQAALGHADVILAPTTLSLTYTDAIAEARRQGARVVTMPVISEDAFVRVGTAEVDEVAAVTRAAGARLSRARSLHLTSPSGTDLQVALGGHPADLLDGLCRHPGEIDQLPAGVASVVAAETSGVLVADASVSRVGWPTIPVRLEVRDSRIVALDGGPEARLLWRLLEEAADENVFHCAAEIGIGTNRWARYVPSHEFSTEGVRSMGWVHVGFGDDHTFPGGSVRARMHNDVLLSDCRLSADGVTLVEAGRLHTDVL